MSLFKTAQLCAALPLVIIVLSTCVPNRSNNDQKRSDEQQSLAKPQESQDAMSIIASCRQAYLSCTSYEDVFEFEKVGPQYLIGPPEKATGTTLYTRSKPSSFYMDLRYKMFSPREEHSVVWKQGEETRLFLSHHGAVVTRPIGNAINLLIGNAESECKFVFWLLLAKERGGGDPFESFDDIRLVGVEKLDSIECYIIECRTALDSDSMSRFWIGKQTHLIYKTQSTRPGVTGISYHRPRVNHPIDEERFKFVPPPGTARSS